MTRTSKTQIRSKKSFRYVQKNWDEFWAEFWRIRLVKDDEAVVWKNQQVVEFCWQVLELRKGMSLLDLGCGAGFQAELLAERGIHVHGVDISPRLIAHANATAKSRGITATYEVGDMRSFRANAAFDRVVVLGMSFGFGTDQENRETVNNIFRATKPGGKILLTGQHPYSATTHTGPEWLETREGILFHQGQFDPLTSRLGGSWELACPDGTIVTEGENPESDGIRCYSVPEMRSLLQDAGFTNPAFYGSWLLPPGDLQWFSMEMISVADKAKRSTKQHRR